MRCIECGKPTEEGATRCLTCAAEENLRQQTNLERETEEAEYYARPLVGVGGWLALFWFLLLISSISQVSNTWNEFSLLKGSTVQTWREFLVGMASAVFLLTLLSFSGCVLWALIAHKSWAPRLTRFYLAVRFFVSLSPLVAASFQNSASDSPQLGGFFLAAAVDALVCATWFGYFCVSRRVKLTYPSVLPPVLRYSA
jgi:uncharacterized protein DUF2569